MKLLKYFFIITLILIGSCKDKIGDAVNKIESIENDVKLNLRQSSRGYTMQCYEYIHVEDTLRLILDKPDYERITGSFFTRFKGREAESGVIQGQIKGDTIIADYISMKQGKQYIREVAFLNEGDYILQGFAAMDSLNGKIVFIKESPIRYDQTVKLEARDCW